MIGVEICVQGIRTKYDWCVNMCTGNPYTKYDCVEICVQGIHIQNMIGVEICVGLHGIHIQNMIVWKYGNPFQATGADSRFFSNWGAGVG